MSSFVVFELCLPIINIAYDKSCWFIITESIKSMYLTITAFCNALTTDLLPSLYGAILAHFWIDQKENILLRFYILNPFYIHKLLVYISKTERLLDK